MGNIPQFPITVDALTGGVESHRFLEIPISGPGTANTLVTITGVAIPAADEQSGTQDEKEPLIHGDIYITTDYRLKDSDKFLPPAATYVSLASITYDDEEGTPLSIPAPAFTAAIDSIDTTVNTDDNRIQVHLVVGIQGDTTINRISYQVNALLQKAEG
jgi:hypothetical protein